MVGLVQPSQGMAPGYPCSWGIWIMLSDVWSDFLVVLCGARGWISSNSGYSMILWFKWQRWAVAFLPSWVSSKRVSYCPILSWCAEHGALHTYSQMSLEVTTSLLLVSMLFFQVAGLASSDGSKYSFLLWLAENLGPVSAPDHGYMHFSPLFLQHREETGIFMSQPWEGTWERCAAVLTDAITKESILCFQEENPDGDRKLNNNNKVMKMEKQPSKREWTRQLNALKIVHSSLSQRWERAASWNQKVRGKYSLQSSEWYHNSKD